MAGECDTDRSAATAALAAATRLRKWLVSTDLRGYDPYDALRSPLLARIGGAGGRRAAIQIVRRLPLNPRPLLGIAPYPNAKGLALVASGAARLYTLTGDGEWRALADRAATETVRLAVPAEDGVAWGYPFDVQFRWGSYGADSPNVIATAFAATALAEVAPVLGRPELARTAAGSRAFLDALLVGEREHWYSYVRGNPTPIHNANLLAAATRARLAAQEGEALPPGVTAAAAFSVARQRPDGAWPYGEGPGLEWIDGFHTAYVLTALADLDELDPSLGLRKALECGASFYVERLFDPDGAPRYLTTSRYPLDSHNAATAMATLVRIASYEPRARPLSKRVLAFSLANLQTRYGWFVYQRGRLHVKRVPYHRWSDAHMLNALALMAGEAPR